MNFLDKADQWNAYVSAIKSGLLAEGTPLGWNGDGFGMRADGGRIAGASQLAAFARADLIDTELDEFLTAPFTPHGRTVADFLIENMIELHLEPGRSLFDQMGLTAARVNFTKRTVKGEWLVGLDMNRSNLDVTDREFFVDPILLSSTMNPTHSPVSVFFGGNLCLPGDIVYRHRTFLDRLPESDDVVVFPNTAGYFMDFIESETLLQRIAPKVAVTSTAGDLSWARDEDYTPLTHGVFS